MATTTQTSAQFRLDLQDAAKGLLVAVLGAFLYALENSLQAGQLTFNWKQIGGAALAAGLGYLTKNYFTPAKTVIPAE
jgi:hypothetical protein